MARALPDDGMVDVGGGTSLHVHCVGDGSPLVVLDECSGCDAQSWHAIQPGIGRFTRACAYDRAGVMYSSPPPSRPHLARQLVGELRRLLGDRDDLGPVVLVGQGTGGLVDQIYARDFPRSVVGMVLVDTATKDYDSRYYAQFPPEALAKLKEGRQEPPEYLDFDDQVHAMQDLRNAPLSLGDRPLFVVNHGKPWAHPLYGIPAESWAKLETVWMAMEADVASLSTNSLHVAATEAEWIPDEAPDRVVTAAWDVVSSARTGVPLSRLTTASPPSASSTASTVPASARPHAVPLDDGLVDIGSGMLLHIHCLGSGAPAVVLDAGLGNDGSSWAMVQPEVGTFTRACVIDRAGMGYSSQPASVRHSMLEIPEEIHTTVARAGIVPPYVMVGHSFGGMNARLLAAQHPDDVAGMVLVDTPPDDQPAVLDPLLPADVLAGFREMLAHNPERFDYDTWLGGFRELASRSRSIGDKPLVVLTAGDKQKRFPDLPPELQAKMHRVWLETQARLARLSTNSVQVVVPQAGHFVHGDAPKVFVASVREVVEAVRTHQPIAKAPIAAAASASF